MQLHRRQQCVYLAQFNVDSVLFNNGVDITKSINYETTDPGDLQETIVSSFSSIQFKFNFHPKVSKT